MAVKENTMSDHKSDNRQDNKNKDARPSTEQAAQAAGFQNDKAPGSEDRQPGGTADKK